jgi:hypothetical protein
MDFGVGKREIFESGHCLGSEFEGFVDQVGGGVEFLLQSPMPTVDGDELGGTLQVELFFEAITALLVGAFVLGQPGLDLGAVPVQRCGIGAERPSGGFFSPDGVRFRFGLSILISHGGKATPFECPKPKAPLGGWDVSEKNEGYRQVFEVFADGWRAKQEKPVEDYCNPRRFAISARSWTAPALWRFGK